MYKLPYIIKAIYNDDLTVTLNLVIIHVNL